MDILSFLKKEYIPLNTIEVSSSALRHNYQYLSQSSGLKIAPVLKSNAYGHGLVLTAKILDEIHAPFLCVDSIYEAYELLKNNIRTKILILGYVDPRNLAVKKLPFSYAVATREMLDAVFNYQPHAGMHIFVDTGMRREGISINDLPEVILQIQTMKGVTIEGLMSHFAAADKNDTLTQKQVDNFQKAQKMLRDAGINPKWIHMANSSGVLNYKKYKDKIGNLARAGIAQFGIDLENKDKILQPTLQFSSTLVQIKDLAKGESSGYDFTFTAKKEMRIGVVAAGYNDGVDRRLSNKGFTKVGETYCPIIGRVSMNLTMIDVSAVTDPEVGDKVVIYSHNPQDKNSFSNAAAMIDTIPYDLLVKLAASTKRVIV